MTCENCVYWERGLATISRGKWKDYSAGDCKRHAPLVTGGLHCAEMTIWPQVSLNDWCGDHEAMTPPQKATP